MSSSKNNDAPMYSSWRSKSTQKIHIVLGFCMIPELKEYGIILSGDKTLTVTPKFLLTKFEKA